MTERFTPIVSRITRWNSVCRAGEGEEEREGERNGRNGSIRFSPRPLSSDPRAPRDPVRGDPFRRRFARNSVSPRQSSSIGLNGAIGIARSLPGNGVSFRSIPFRFVTTKARYRVFNLDVSTRDVSDDALQPRIKSPRSAASCAGEIRKGISSRVFFDRWIYSVITLRRLIVREREREGFLKVWGIKIKISRLIFYSNVESENSSNFFQFFGRYDCRDQQRNWFPEIFAWLMYDFERNIERYNA